MAETRGVISIAPYFFIHVLDNNTLVTRVICGPQRYTKNESESIVSGPTEMIKVPPRQYVLINNPHLRDSSGEPLYDEHGQVKLAHGDSEYRLADAWPAPFPLYPGEVQALPVARLEVVAKNHALRLRAVRDFTDEAAAGGGAAAAAAAARVAGDEWLFMGPATYLPRVEVERLDVVKAQVVKSNRALHLRARRPCRDQQGKPRRAGEEWLVTETGAYMPSVDEEVVGMIQARVITEKRALHLRARRAFADAYGRARRAGEEWLVTLGMADAHLQGINEEVVGEVPITTLSNREYCVVLDPYVDGVQRRGTRELRKGEQSFFLHPGESLEFDVESVHVLADDEALLLQAYESFLDQSEAPAVARRPGERWMVYGPREYIPPVEVHVVERRRAMPLDANEGLYVRDARTGHVRAVVGETYMLKPTEAPWEKELPAAVEGLLGGRRDKARVVTYRVKENSVVQVYDYKKKTARVVFGPDMIMLQPDEQFSVVRLTGGWPKRENAITSLHLSLGPDFMTDDLIVETSDHARLQLTLSYNWRFNVEDRERDGPKVFKVRDFVGDVIKSIASRVRGAVAGETFDNFHKNSAKIIRRAVFGKNFEEEEGATLTFTANRLEITNIDIQSVEPVEDATRASLSKSVQMAIEITTNSQEARARHQAGAEEEDAKGLLEQQRLRNEAENEAARKALLGLRAESAAITSLGQAANEARARAEAELIAARAEVKQAKLEAEAAAIEARSRLGEARAEREAEAAHAERMNALEVEKARALMEVELKRFQSQVDAIGRETIEEIARAGPEMQAKLLKGLGLKGFLVTDGKSPINLFNTAQGMVGGPALDAAMQQQQQGQQA
mmetsp:Transcript_35292/g.58082  ORF Transcript_35292/g.58082 Transcript_35292/m.58082 type:complete len:847 (-) Transcript_35292:522-3062(-)